MIEAPFVVRVNFVDDTYWDDGSRYTNRDHGFDTLSEAVTFRHKVLKKRWFEATSGVTGERFRQFIDDAGAIIWRRVDDDWVKIENDDAISLLGEIVKEAEGD